MRPSIPKGTRDFSPSEMTKRNYIFNTIRKIFQQYGYLQIETPSFENSSTLMGKYGEEGDKLIFKILNSGNYFSDFKNDAELLEAKAKGERFLSTKIADKALRYDLTVPFARYVVMHQNEITFPFRRFQIQPVWRADRPQKGRYREFYQCDADVIGTDSLLCEAELLRMTRQVFAEFGLGITIKLNNRKVLAGIAEVMGAKESIIDITVAMDKLDKIGLDKVKEEMLSKNISAEAISKLEPLLVFTGTDAEKIAFLKNLVSSSETGMKGIAELETLFGYTSAVGITSSQLELDLTLARGLNYYTGAIIEVKVNDERSAFNSSICGGGRYDDLTGIFGLPGMSGVGISFGADRIYDVLEELNLFPAEEIQQTRLLIINFGDEQIKYAFDILDQLHKHNISAELYPDAAKMKKQISYADARGIPYIALAGSAEQEQRIITVKDIRSGKQEQIPFESIVPYLSNI